MALYTPEYKPNGNEIAVLTTSKGTIRVQLAGNDAPIHVGNFVELSQKGYYDGLKFHRYVPALSSRAAARTRATSPLSRSSMKALVAAAVRATRAIPSMRSTPPTRTMCTRTARSPWPVRQTPTPRAPSSTSAWARSPSSMTVTPCSARPSRAKTSSVSFAWAM